MEIEISKDAKMATFTHGGYAITVDLRERADIERLQHVLLDAEMECRMIPAYIDPGIPLTPEQDEEIRDRLHATPSADEPTALAFTDFAKERCRTGWRTRAGDATGVGGTGCSGMTGRNDS